MRVLVLLALICAAGSLPAETPRPAPKLPPDYEARIAALEAARQAHPRDIAVLDSLAGSYTMAGEYDKAIAVLHELQAIQTNNPDLQLRLARNQSFAGRTRAAIDNYRGYLNARPEDREASIELIRLWRYHGDYGKAEKLCNKLLQSKPDDQVVLALKVEVLHWAGDRRYLAKRTAEQAVRAAAGYPDAQVAQVYALRDLGENRRAQEGFDRLRNQVARSGGPPPEASYGDAYRLLEEDLAHPARLTSTPAYSVYNDADGIHNSFWSIRLEAPLRGDHTLLLNLNDSRSSAPLGSVFTDGRSSVHGSEFAAGGTFRLAPATYVTLLGGGFHRQGAGGLEPTYDVRFATSPIDRLTFDFSTGREFLKVTPRAMDRDMSSYRTGGGVQYAFDARTSLSARADRRYWSDANRSIGADATLRRILHYHKPFMIDAGALTHWEMFDRDTRFAAGFFTPEQYRRYDGFLGLHGEIGRRLYYDLRGATGAQKIARGADYRLDWETTASAGLKLSRSLRLWANYQRRNYTLLSRDGWYQGFYVSLGFEQ